MVGIKKENKKKKKGKVHLLPSRNTDENLSRFVLKVAGEKSQTIEFKGKDEVEFVITSWFVH